MMRGVSLFVLGYGCDTGSGAVVAVSQRQQDGILGEAQARRAGTSEIHSSQCRQSPGEHRIDRGQQRLLQESHASTGQFSSENILDPSRTLRPLSAPLLLVSTSPSPSHTARIIHTLLHLHLQQPHPSTPKAQRHSKLTRSNKLGSTNSTQKQVPIKTTCHCHRHQTAKLPTEQ